MGQTLGVYGNGSFLMYRASTAKGNCMEQLLKTNPAPASFLPDTNMHHAVALCRDTSGLAESEKYSGYVKTVPRIVDTLSSDNRQGA